MVFSTATFLFLFLPLVLGLYFVLPAKLRNSWLLLASLFFYAWGETWIVVVMLASIAGNFGLALLMEGKNGERSERTRKLVVAAALVLNLGLLVAFKYTNFLVENLDFIFARLGMHALDVPKISLPIGISFFTFQALSYVIDVYRREAAVQRNPIDFGLYIALFPQLIAGPIVRYHDVAMQILHRTITSAKFAEGIRRFIFGLAKKMLIANTAAAMADQIFALPNGDLTAGLAWLGTLSYTIQIYFDFSGYSDMAIGLGLMFGFRYLENFNFPYIASSITRFWRRWHMSLSTWFRDYLYIPLGGNRGSKGRTYFNLLLVFLLCGLWHGASWTFMAWGAYHGLFLVIERLGFGRVLDRVWRPLQHVYTLLAVIVGWVLFRAESFTQALAFLEAMVGLGAGDGALRNPGYYLGNEQVAVLILGCLFSMPIAPWVGNRIGNRLTELGSSGLRWQLLRTCSYASLIVILGALLMLCSAKMAVGTYNPFIYFRF